DASAAEANPAGLTILRKAEISIEGRQTTTAQHFVTGGTFPYITTAEFPSRQSSVSFASAVMPQRHGVIALYYHRPLAFRNRVDITGRFAAPVFYLGPNGPVTRDQCASIPTCTQHQVYPFSTSADVSIETIGLAAARQWRTLSFGAALRFQRFQEIADTFRRDVDGARPADVHHHSGQRRAHPRPND